SLEERLKTITEEQFIELFESLNSKKEIVRFDIGIVDFLGFVFPAFPSNKIKFNIYKLQLEYARYYNFAEAVFEGEARFDYHTFDNAMLFSHTEFKEILTFKESTIMSDIEFDGVTFKPFIQYDSHNTFWRTQVQGKNFIMKNIDSCISIEGILMSKNTNLVLENVNFTRLNLIAGEQAFRLAKQQSTIVGDKKKASEYNFREMSIKGDLIMPPLKIWRKDNEGKKKFVMFQNIKLYKHYKYILPKLGDILSRLTLGYGEKPTRSLGISFLVILFFSLAFMKSGLTFSFVQENSGIIQYDFNLIEIFKVIFQLDIDTIVKVSQEWGNFFYFSIVTFSTVGYGDITTVNALGRFLASIEMALGVTMAGIWVATLLRKMMN
ncbi:MAG: potassium channel family protein, partial [Candidatus Cloacimonadota bacterium]|nr:potassium channel family protein [Candidatus Cloacimonadota bacterium]